MMPCDDFIDSFPIVPYLIMNYIIVDVRNACTRVTVIISFVFHFLWGFVA
ncbi:hypothetical protein Sjap_000556 [Stephania japonica]|uniref:Uncharacterized protein n=1 Tax=Stephania japonica TaxID=461633 RepID=A0AAP0KIA1_9MAGN